MTKYTGPVVSVGNKWLFYNEEQDHNQRLTTASKSDSLAIKIKCEIDLTSRADHYLGVEGELEANSLDWLCSAKIVDDGGKQA